MGEFSKNQIFHVNDTFFGDFGVKSRPKNRYDAMIFVNNVY